MSQFNIPSAGRAGLKAYVSQTGLKGRSTKKTQTSQEQVHHGVMVKNPPESMNE